MAITAGPRPLTFAVFVAAALVLAAGPAAAKDFCIDRTSTGVNPDFVIRNFKVPKAGKCKAVIGVGNPLTAILLNGVACGASDGTHVSFQLNGGSMPGPLGATVQSTGSSFGVNVVLATDTLEGLASLYSGDTVSGGAATGVECKVPAIP